MLVTLFMVFFDTINLLWSLSALLPSNRRLLRDAYLPTRIKVTGGFLGYISRQSGTKESMGQLVLLDFLFNIKNHGQNQSNVFLLWLALQSYMHSNANGSWYEQPPNWLPLSKKSLNSLKSRAVGWSTIKFWNFLAEGHST